VPITFGDTLPHPCRRPGKTFIMSVVMAEDGYSSSAWDTTDNSDLNSSSYPTSASQPHPPALEIVEDHLSIPPIPSKSVSPPPRSSSDSASRWHDNIPVTVDRCDTTLSTIPSETTGLVETAFDENVLRALCELDVSISNLCCSLRSRLLICHICGSAVFRYY
jgi:Rho GTPase-activating protein RGD1